MLFFSPSIFPAHHFRSCSVSSSISLALARSLSLAHSSFTNLTYSHSGPPPYRPSSKVVIVLSRLDFDLNLPSDRPRSCPSFVRGFSSFHSIQSAPLSRLGPAPVSRLFCVVTSLHSLGQAFAAVLSFLLLTFALPLHASQLSLSFPTFAHLPRRAAPSPPRECVPSTSSLG